jgi:2-C-methyl-D-erythritol 2,4-cyclodiphosphate synthase
MGLRIGFGFDTHGLKEGVPFMLGGIRIDHPRGPYGHSDADVLIHALCDALLGAAGLRDIGFQFPDTSDEFKGIDSKVLLGRTVALITSKGYSIVNIDATVVLQSPRISALIPGMISTLSPILGISPDQLSIKAKTSEKLGFIGREEGVSAHAAVLLS